MPVTPDVHACRYVNFWKKYERGIWIGDIRHEMDVIYRGTNMPVDEPRVLPATVRDVCDDPRGRGCEGAMCE